ncbi:hypothetical protein U9M48_002162 [Paspalum notatum var. saurae]|uniref:Uncharacterized protein n=1 Tax=Paspalum notatum var. saurae TaxID=547442 RepID=A0AAQ3PKI4_PASNO
MVIKHILVPLWKPGRFGKRRGRRGSRHPGSGSSRSSSMVDALGRAGSRWPCASVRCGGRSPILTLGVRRSGPSSCLGAISLQTWSLRLTDGPRWYIDAITAPRLSLLSIVCGGSLARSPRARGSLLQLLVEGACGRGLPRTVALLSLQRRRSPCAGLLAFASSAQECSGDVASCRSLSAGSIPVRSLVRCPSLPHFIYGAGKGMAAPWLVVGSPGWDRMVMDGCIGFGRSVGDVPTSCMGTPAACSRTCLDPCSTKPQDAGCSPGLELDPMAWAPDPCSLGLAFDPMIVELEAARAPSSPILSGCSFEESEDLSFALAASPFPPSMVMSVTGERVDPMVVELEATLGNALVMPSSPPLFECPFAERDGPTFGPPVSPLPPSTGSSVAGCPDARVGSP